MFKGSAPMIRAHGALCMAVVGAVIYLTACTSAQITVKTPLYQYKPDMLITVDGATFDGMAVTALGKKDIQIISKARLDLLMISSCHRNFTIEKVDHDWFGGSGKTYTYHYEPTEIESEGFCPLYIQAFDIKGITAWGYLAFRTTEKLPAKTQCNGTDWSFAGVSVCATRAGFEQGISFSKPVRYVAGDKCEVKKKDDKSFRLRAHEGFCYITFTDGTDYHRVVLLGYTEALIRGE